MRSLLQYSITLLARMTVFRFRPMIIAITGSVGKTSTKEAIACVVRTRYIVRSSGGNLNNELGVPLTILGDWTDEYYSRGGTPWFWCKVVLIGLVQLVFSRSYPRALILEYGADRPGDIRRLARMFRPHIGVITAIGETPVHVEFFAGPEGVAREKSELIRSLAATDYAILNADDATVLDMKDVTKANILTFGRAEHAHLRISNLEILTDAVEKPEGIIGKLHDAHSFVPVKILGSLGISHAMAAAAAGAVAHALDIHLVTVSEALQKYRGPAGRLRILEGIKNSSIIDDTYNASPIAMHVAIEVLRDVPALAGARRIAVLGDMRELGRYTLQAHEAIGNRVGAVADVLVCVGEKATFIADAARNQMLRENIFTFSTADEARGAVQKLVREHDVILVKGSQGMRMEKIVEEIMAHPERKRELLVRQSDTWLKKENGTTQ